MVLQLTSKLKGSIDKLLRPHWSGGWSGFCPVCKRPVEVKQCLSSPAARRVVPREARGNFAFVICLWGSSKDYVLGALVLAHSILKTKTKHKLVCLHADDVPANYVELLRIFWDCREVEHMEVKAAYRLSTDNYIEESRFQKVFTKLRALKLVEFEKVMVMDIDLLVMSNIDDLFDLPAPAAMKRGMNRGKRQYKHGDEIDGSTFFAGLKPGDEHSWGQGTGINAGVMVLEPNEEDHRVMEEELLELNHPGHVRGNGPEQDYLSRFYADRPWRHISVINNFQVHHMFNALHPDIVDSAERSTICEKEGYKAVRIVHYSGDSGVKPWTRCLQGMCGWPERSKEQDEAYTLKFAGDLHSYSLWVLKDRERWDRMERNMFEESDLKGFSLGEDGIIYHQAERDGEKMPREPPREAVEAASAAVRYFLDQWFATLSDADEYVKTNGRLEKDLVTSLKEAVVHPVQPTQSVQPASSTADRCEGASSSRSQKRRGAASPCDVPTPTRDRADCREAWSAWSAWSALPARKGRSAEIGSAGSAGRGSRGRTWCIEGGDVVVSCCTKFIHFVGPGFCKTVTPQPAHAEQLAGEEGHDELSGLYVMVVGGRERHFALDSELDHIATWASTNIEKGDVVLAAVVGSSRVLAALEGIVVPRLPSEEQSALRVFAAAGRAFIDKSWDARAGELAAVAHVSSQRRNRAPQPPPAPVPVTPSPPPPPPSACNE
eukprot:TRINITY_DN28247_c0_g1_i1.p1 TRINITY_DN28247_c0_g1~~TRINITY_DN28247_c0_g1_i1.p1  ORF type:complete len:825 (-),score=156.60 TRINITY_DN28247_c0_g1_i1:6-2159(-)